jgi:hypothetical protein
LVCGIGFAEHVENWLSKSNVDVFKTVFLVTGRLGKTAQTIAGEMAKNTGRASCSGGRRANHFFPPESRRLGFMLGILTRTRTDAPEAWHENVHIIAHGRLSRSALRWTFFPPGE